MRAVFPRVRGWGVAHLANGVTECMAKLISNGWPELQHIFQLDVAEFYLHDGGGFTKLYELDGELHHEVKAP